MARPCACSPGGAYWTERYPAIARAAVRLRAVSFTLDGEAVVCGADGIAIFDALHRHGADLRPMSLGERKTRLAKLLRRAPADRTRHPYRR
jgi:bifunctional non-homologous end joining protein LigD